MKPSSGKRLGFFIGLGVLLGVLGFGLVVWPVVHAGSFELQIQEADGTGFSLVLPVILLDLGIKLIPEAVADEMRGEMDGELVHCRDAALAVCAALQRAPDCVLVEVEAPGERVRVASRDGKLRVDVQEASGESVQVVLPLKAVAAFLDKVMPRA